VLTELGLDLLARRGMLSPPAPAADDPDSDRVALRAAPALGMVLTARSRPSVVAACQVQGQDGAHDPRLFGIAEQGRGLRVLLVEHLTSERADPVRNALGRKVKYYLVTPAQAGRTLASWAAAPARGGRFGQPRPPRVVDVYAGRDQAAGGPVSDRFLIRAGRSGISVEEARPATRPAEPVDCDEAGLADLLTDALARAAAA
jgi:hypothetical protein